MTETTLIETTNQFIETYSAKFGVMLDPTAVMDYAIKTQYVDIDPDTNCCGGSGYAKGYMDGKMAIYDAKDKFELAADSGNNLVNICFGLAKAAGWHNDLTTGEPIKHNLPTRLMLIVTEIAEAMEGHRKNLNDDHLPNRKMVEVELADAVIRICDLAGSEGYDLGGAIAEKLKYNQNRADHKPENRIKENGKKL